ncbi:histidine kinase [Chitinophagaceae bacterium IBVUCB1]|nr:histidine kinase [Chitinophagaceae bacterium IBVUCB1]
MRQYFNWKTYLIIIAMCIVGASLYYTNQLAAKLAEEERKNIAQLVEALKVPNSTEDPVALQFAGMVLEQNKTIPLILTDDSGKILSHSNLDSVEVAKNKNYPNEQLAVFKANNQPLVFEYNSGKQHVYYGESSLLMQLRYYPYVQLTVIILFLAIVLLALTSAHRSLQNQVWVGLSKETAHQLGTPLSSIEGWLEILKDDSGNADALTEMQKDLDRLKLVADRFSKVGSAPQLEEEDLVTRLQAMVDYMQKRAPSKVAITLQNSDAEIPVNISGPLFDWVIENLMRNALDAMDGKGRIEVQVQNQKHQVLVDVSDTGKGIPKHQLKRVFVPGFTTKKRGWGLGLSLSKRIIEKYHHGSLFVKQSEAGKGTTFRIILRR